MAKRAPQIERALDELVPEFSPRAAEPALRRYARLAGKILAGALLAVAMMAAIFYVLHKHVRDAQTAPAPKKPVVIQIFPVQK